MLWILILVGCTGEDECDCDAQVTWLLKDVEQLRTENQGLAEEVHRLRMDIEGLEVPNGLSVPEEPKCQQIDGVYVLPPLEQWSDLSALPDQARITAPDRDPWVGVRLVGVRANSLLASCGLRSGDTVQRIAGIEVLGQGKVVEAFGAVRNASEEFEVVISRGTSDRTNRYRPAP